MSDFPKGCNIASTRAWLEGKEFEGLFVGWSAIALLGADKEDILIYTIIDYSTGEDDSERL
jgi:hypothetical protein